MTKDLHAIDFPLHPHSKQHPGALQIMPEVSCVTAYRRHYTFVHSAFATGMDMRQNYIKRNRMV